MVRIESYLIDLIYNRLRKGLRSEKRNAKWKKENYLLIRRDND